MTKKKKIIEPDDIDNKWELGAYMIKNWWKVLILIFAVGIFVTGFTCDFKNKTFTKNPVQIKSGIRK